MARALVPQTRGSRFKPGQLQDNYMIKYQGLQAGHFYYPNDGKETVCLVIEKDEKMLKLITWHILDGRRFRVNIDRKTFEEDYRYFWKETVLRNRRIDNELLNMRREFIRIFFTMTSEQWRPI